jgi:hypothetical protein
MKHLAESRGQPLADSSRDANRPPFQAKNANSKTRAVPSYVQDPRLAAIVAAWPTLPEAVRDQLAERVAAAITEAPAARAGLR